MDNSGSVNQNKRQKPGDWSGIDQTNERIIEQRSKASIEMKQNVHNAASTHSKVFRTAKKDTENSGWQSIAVTAIVMLMQGLKFTSLDFAKSPAFDTISQAIGTGANGYITSQQQSVSFLASARDARDGTSARMAEGQNSAWSQLKLQAESQHNNIKQTQHDFSSNLMHIITNLIQVQN